MMTTMMLMNYAVNAMHAAIIAAIVDAIVAARECANLSQ